MTDKPSREFIDRTTMHRGDVEIGPASPEGDGQKFYVGIDHEPTEEEALEMGRHLYDAIQTDRADRARSRE